MNIKRIIVATGNQGKLKEVKEILKDIDAPVYSIKELGIISNPEETGETFGENAFIKARAIKMEDGDIVIADDSGLEIDYLDGRPGVHTSRYMGEETPHSVKMDGILKEMKDCPADKRSARFKSAVALVASDGTEFLAEGTMEGKIGYEKRGEAGFGYDPIFIIDAYNKTGAEIPLEMKNAVSHRGQALKKIQKFLEKF